MVPKTCEKKAFFERLLECDDRLTTETSIYGTVYGKCFGPLDIGGLYSLNQSNATRGTFVKPV